MENSIGTYFDLNLKIKNRRWLTPVSVYKKGPSSMDNNIKTLAGFKDNRLEIDPKFADKAVDDQGPCSSASNLSFALSQVWSVNVKERLQGS